VGIGRSGCRQRSRPSRSPRRELRWWVVRRELGLTSGKAVGQAIAFFYAAIYRVPEAAVAEAGRLRGRAAEGRDREAARPAGDSGAYWPTVHRLLRASYGSLHDALTAPAGWATAPRAIPDGP
jgi:hypothetical protein